MIDIFYDIMGEQPNESDYKYTKLNIDYLLEAGVTKEKLLSAFGRMKITNRLELDMLPNSIYDGSLIKKDKFYYHKELQVISPPPTWDNDSPFYREMKIVYTYEDLIRYFGNKFHVDYVYICEEKNAIDYLMKQYSRYNFIEPLDIILGLIDYVSSLSVKCLKFFDLRNYETEYISIISSDIENARRMNKNKVIRRTEVLCGI